MHMTGKIQTSTALTRRARHFKPGTAASDVDGVWNFAALGPKPGPGSLNPNKSLSNNYDFQCVNHCLSFLSQNYLPIHDQHAHRIASHRCSCQEEMFDRLDSKGKGDVTLDQLVEGASIDEGFQSRLPLG